MRTAIGRIKIAIRKEGYFAYLKQEYFKRYLRKEDSGTEANLLMMEAQMEKEREVVLKYIGLEIRRINMNVPIKLWQKEPNSAAVSAVNEIFAEHFPAYIAL